MRTTPDPIISEEDLEWFEDNPHYVDVYHHAFREGYRAALKAVTTEQMSLVDLS